MEYYFDKVLNAIQQEVCYSQYASYELTIIQATNKLNAYYAARNTSLENVYQASFIDECANAKCDDATAALAGAITGNSGLFGCDMLQILYNGDVNEGYFQGWRDQVTTKAAYLQTLVNLGVTAQSSYMTLITQHSEAWTVV
jgi:hypothetical protein